ncbi:MAG TPA: hypothetical protein VIX89_06755 [Bryobacteraceae bacterium]
MFQLPVSGIDFHLRTPAGQEDLLLLETQAAEAELAAMLLARVAGREGGIEWTALPVADVEAALLMLRQITAGDVLRADVRCTAAGCGARVDLSFRVSEYLAHSIPRMPDNVAAAEGEGWYALRGTEVRFRIPTLADQIAITGLPRAEAELARRTIRPADAAAANVRKAQQAMDIIAPCLSQPLQGICVECKQALSIHFDVYSFVLRELRRRAAQIYQDVHLIAQRYHWPESRILAMPSIRRQQYAGMILEERGA